MLNLDEIRARAEKAEEGPWITKGKPTDICMHVGSVNGKFETGCILFGGKVETANFIAHARADVPALIAEVERLRERVAELEDEVEEQRTSILALMTVGDE